MHSSRSVHTPALRTVGNIVAGGDSEQTQLIINCSALPSLLILLDRPQKGIRTEACWTISNITASNPVQIQAVIDARLIPKLIQMLSEKDEMAACKEAAWAVSNAASNGSIEQVRYLVSTGCIKPFCALITFAEPKIVRIVAEGIKNILKVGDIEMKRDASGVNQMVTLIDEDSWKTIQSLQKHTDESIRKDANTMLMLRNNQSTVQPTVQPTVLK